MINVSCGLSSRDPAQVSAIRTWSPLQTAAGPPGCRRTSTRGRQSAGVSASSGSLAPPPQPQSHVCQRGRPAQTPGGGNKVIKFCVTKKTFQDLLAMQTFDVEHSIHFNAAFLLYVNYIILYFMCLLCDSFRQICDMTKHTNRNREFNNIVWQGRVYPKHKSHYFLCCFSQTNMWLDKALK